MNPLVEIIAREARKSGAIPFDRYMELALYCPVYGYYEKEADTIGRAGDFFTSVSVGSLFGELLAVQFAEWLDDLADAGGEARILEAGAHHGRLAADILSRLRATRPELFGRIEYWILEPSGRRRSIQEQSLSEHAPKVRWITRARDLPPGPERAPGFRGIIFSNELLDSMPVRRFGWDKANGKWFEWGVAVRNGECAWARLEIELPNPGSEARGVSPASAGWPLPLLDALPDAFVTETCPAAVAWWSEAARALRCGKLLTIDYGYGAGEALIPERAAGTLRAYHRHHNARDLLANPGGQDITAHVDFGAIQSSGEAAGLDTEEFVTQEKFLAEIIRRHWHGQPPPGWSAAKARQFQTLTHPEHLGGRFRVLIQSRNLPARSR